MAKFGFAHYKPSLHDLRIQSHSTSTCLCPQPFVRLLSLNFFHGAPPPFKQLQTDGGGGALDDLNSIFSPLPKTQRYARQWHPPHITVPWAKGEIRLERLRVKMRVILSRYLERKFKIWVLGDRFIIQDPLERAIGSNAHSNTKMTQAPQRRTSPREK